MSELCKAGGMAVILLVAVVFMGCGGSNDSEPATPAPHEVGAPTPTPTPAPAPMPHAALNPTRPAAMPPNFPKDLPKLAGFELRKVTPGIKGNSVLTLAGKGEPGALRSDYEKQLVETGWTIGWSSGDSGKDVIFATKGERSLALVLEAKGDEVEATLSTS